MPLLNRLSPTFRACIHEEYRRVWTRREYLTLLFALAAVEVLRVTTTWLALRGQSRPGNGPTDLLGLVGLTSWMTYVGHFSSARVFPTVPGQWVFWAASEFLSLFPVLLPYYAGRSIATARKYRELDELRARGLNASQLLLGRGIAHLAPFLVVWAVSALVSLLQTGYFVALGRGARPFLSGSGLVIELVVLLLFTPLGSLARMGILVCASALNRRVWGGVALCYALFLLLYPGLMLAARAATASFTGPFTNYGSIVLISSVPQIAVTVLSFALLALFYPLALRGLAGQPLVSLPRMDEPRGLWVDPDEQPPGPAREG